MKWRIAYYETADGKSPIFTFIENVSTKTQAKIANTLDLLEEYGTTLGAPHVKKLSGYPLWELRILGSDNIRIFYITQSGKTFLLLHGFLKKKQKTDRKEIKTALARLKEFSTRSK